jgi:hypothetical protein
MAIALAEPKLHGKQEYHQYTDSEWKDLPGDGRPQHVAHLALYNHFRNFR